jgi:hypothetical protein
MDIITIANVAMALTLITGESVPVVFASTRREVGHERVCVSHADGLHDLRGF